ncbi:hypothetical protein A5630_19845 [Mycolicibacterium mucogenicum]|uniref:HPP family protein n=1 Tax=Mycolicibacterium mucogenicum TaxID=56689 RepID=A0A1A3H5B1_MYCMU|nr:hypothetical protein [Mycolicibacterium mucogenicum]OBJ42824.1 hypothetical protein A5630_19845 [Mycolicibacterium mucogenicum]
MTELDDDAGPPAHARLIDTPCGWARVASAVTAGAGARSWWRWPLPLILIAPMLAVGYGFGERALIFPEGAALAFGVLVVGKPDWIGSRWRLGVLPTVCAVAGTVLAGFPLPKVTAETLALGLAVAVAQVAGGRLGPVISAAVLPVVFGVTSWLYPAAVAAMCVSLAVLVSVPALRVPALEPPPPRRWGWMSLVAFAVVAVGWIVAATVVLPLPAVAVAPPLLVAALEWCTHGAHQPTVGLRRWAVLVAAAAIGGAASTACPVITPGLTATRVVIATTIQLAAAAVVLILLAWTREYAYPALAIVLVPNLVAPIAVWSYTLAIGAGAGALFAGGWVVAAAARGGARLWAAARHQRRRRRHT